MISRASGLFILGVIILLGSYFYSCGGKAGEGGNTDTADEKVVTGDVFGRSIVVHSDTLKINFFELQKAIECFMNCADCGVVPCDPVCDALCKKYSTIISSDDALAPAPDKRAGMILNLSEKAIGLKKMFNYKFILSKKIPVNFKLMYAELDSMLGTLDILYKEALLNKDKNKIKEQLK